MSFENVRVLLDTQVWLGCSRRPSALFQEKPALVISAEMSCFSQPQCVGDRDKVRLASLQLPSRRRIHSAADGPHRITSFPVHHRHALHVASLPAHHRDPFDRLLIAQAQLENVRFFTADRTFRRYKVEIIPASQLASRAEPKS